MRQPPARKAALPAAISVVIPARNEEDLLPRCLASVRRARDQLAAVEPAVRVSVTVVLDECDDGSAAAVAASPGARGLRVEAGSAGAARALGARIALEEPFPPAGLWLANTDADSVVPANWLVHQAALAAAGVELMAGTVEPDPADLDQARLAVWLSAHELADGHSHVFGANLGIRGDLYLRSGGFQPLAHGEDRALVAAAKRLGAVWRATDGCRVRTSGRLHGRARGGFADYLRSETA